MATDSRNPANPAPKKSTPGQRKREDAKERFLTEFGKHGFIKRASDAAGVNRDTVLEWRRHDPEFDVKFRACNDDVTERLEEILYDRCKRDLSAGALIFALKARSPDKYTERRKIEIDTKAFEALVAQVTGIIKRRISDPDLRGAIARDLAELSTNAANEPIADAV